MVYLHHGASMKGYRWLRRGVKFSLMVRGESRADIMLRKADNAPFLLEMNTSPGMTGHSLVPMGARAAGISYEDFVLQLAASASLELHASTDWKPE